MGFFDKFKKKKKQEEADEEILSQTEAGQAENQQEHEPRHIAVCKFRIFYGDCLSVHGDEHEKDKHKAERGADGYDLEHGSKRFLIH